MEKEKVHHFSSELVPSEFEDPELATKLYELEHSPDFVVRRVATADSKGAHLIKQLFTDLEAHGVRVPAFYVFGEDRIEEEKRTILYIIAPKIAGDNLFGHQFTATEKEFARDEVGKLFEGLASYFLDAFRNQEPFLYDIVAARQYVFGKKKGDSEALPYLVDTDPLTSQKLNELFDAVTKLTQEMKSLEYKLDIEFTDARAKFQELLTEADSRNIKNDTAHRALEGFRTILG
jgi:hypothetical protein